MEDLAQALEDVKREVVEVVQGTNDGTATPLGGETAAALPPSVHVKLEEARDGGWPEEYQPIRARAFDKTEYERLHSWFFMECDVTAGSHESLTRRGTLRVTERVTRQKLRIDDWPELRERVQELNRRGERSKALGHLRCLQDYLQGVNRVVPRILRTRDQAADRRLSGLAEIVDVAEIDASRRSVASLCVDGGWEQSEAKRSLPRIKAEPGLSEGVQLSDKGVDGREVSTEFRQTTPLSQPVTVEGAAASTRDDSAASTQDGSEWSVGSLVWAKMGTYPYWPAEVTSLDVLPEGIRARLIKSRRSIRSSKAILVEVRSISTSTFQ
jgi:hypothetical protein